MARNDQSTPALTRIKLTVNPIGPYETMSRLQVKLNSQPDKLQSSIRKLLETFVAENRINSAFLHTWLNAYNGIN